MATVVTDDVHVAQLYAAYLDGFSDLVFEDTDMLDMVIQWYAVEYDDSGVAYGGSGNKYGQQVWFEFPDKISAQEWFDGVAIDDTPNDW